MVSTVRIIAEKNRTLNELELLLNSGLNLEGRQRGSGTVEK